MSVGAGIRLTFFLGMAWSLGQEPDKADGILGSGDLLPKDGLPKLGLENPSFEDGRGEEGARLPNGWRSRLSGFRLSDREPRSGEHCLLLPKTGAPRLFVEQEIVLPDKGWYTLTAYARTDEANFTTAQFVVFGRMSAFARPIAKRPDEAPIARFATLRRAQSDELELMTEWQPLSLAFLAKALEVRVRVDAFVWSGNVLIDDARIEKSPVQPVRGKLKGREDEASWRPRHMRQPSPTAAGEPFVEPPTHNCLGIQWPIEGDYNRNGQVPVRYRKAGEEEWKEALPLLRSMYERINRDQPERDWVCRNKYAGSVFGLAPDESYEVRLKLTDPDGGSTEKLLKASTRAEPRVPEGGRKLRVYSEEYEGKKAEPAFAGLKAAYEQARPGDIILVHAGRYVVPEGQLDKRRAYVLAKDGTFAAPIVIRGAGDGPVVFDGEGAVVLFDLTGADYHLFEGIVAEDADRLFQSSANTGLVIRNCRLRDSNYPIFATQFCRDYTISDYTITGNLPDGEFSPQRKGKSRYGHAVWLYGQGHVVRHNRVKGFWDGINTCGYYLPPGDPSRWLYSIDFHNNLISDCVDDGMELDYSVHNVRAYRNFIYNTGKMGISTQPVYGGPAYIFRNVIVNCTYYPFKLNCWPAGVLIYNNTVLAQTGFRAASIWQNCRIMNNLFLGNDAHGDGGLWTGTPTPETSLLDHNGYRNNRPDRAILWSGFPTHRYDNVSSSERLFPSLAEFSKATGYEANGIWDINYDTFVKAVPPSGKSTPLPDLDLRLRKGSPVIDAGAVLPDITDGFSGKAPDLGAIEFGDSPPHYGPRPTAELRPSE